MTEIVNKTEYGIATKSASGGQIALEWLSQCEFEVMLIEVYAIKEIGVESIRTIRRNYPRLEIIIMSDQNPESAQLTLEAMNMGAIDFIMRESGESSVQSDIKTISEIDAVFTQIKVRQYLPIDNVDKAIEHKTTNVEIKKRFNGEIDLVLITSSTGGPIALEEICRHFPENFSKPVLIVQHMPADFTAVLAASFDKKFRASFSEGKTGDLIKNGQIIIAPGGQHMVIEEVFGKPPTIHLLQTPFVNGVRPSADVLFQSVANVYRGKNILVIVLTGMGNDGTRGVKVLKENCNCYCITQSERSCVVYGMPRCVFNEGLSDEVVDLNDIAYRINQIVSGKGATYG